MSPFTDASQLSLEEQIAQMIVVRASGYLFDHQIRFPRWEPTNQQLRYWLEDLNVGGVILLGGTAAEVAQRTAQLQDWAKTPLLLAADIEEGVGQRFAGATWFPPPMALSEIAKWDLALAKQYGETMGEMTAQDALTLGINWLLAPVVDVNHNPDNPVINVRAFGEDPHIVSELATAFIQGAHRQQVLTTAKHFPGHGDTATDSHFTLPVLNVTEQRLAEIELPPFQSAIAAGVDSIMSGHLLVPAWDQAYPATLSSNVLTQQLRLQLGFEGLIVTDALIMGALDQVTSSEEVSILAIEAGADVLLMPPHPDRAIAAISNAVNQGRLSRERIAASVERIWTAKEKMITAKTGDFLQDLASPEAQQTKEAILKASVKTHGNLPLSLPEPNQSRYNLIIVDDLLHCAFLDRQTSAIALPQQLGYELQLLGQAQVFPSIPENPPLTLVQLFTRGNPFRGEAGLSATTQAYLKALCQKGIVQAIIIYGSPYVLTWLQDNVGNEIPWIFTDAQMEAAQTLALQHCFDQSQLPAYQEKFFI